MVEVINLRMEKELDEHSTAYRVSELRKDRGWKQNELADMIHVTRSQISRLESGETKNIGSDLLVSLAEVFHVSTDYLLGITPISTPKSYEISKLGLSEESVKRLLSKTVDADILNRMIEHKSFPNLCNTIRYYFEDTLLAGIMDRNTLLDLASGSLRDYANMHPEKSDEIKHDIGLIKSQKLGAHEAELDKIRNLFMGIIRDIKSDLESQIPTSSTITEEAFHSIWASTSALPKEQQTVVNLSANVADYLQGVMMDKETAGVAADLVQRVLFQNAKPIPSSVPDEEDDPGDQK